MISLLIHLMHFCRLRRHKSGLCGTMRPLWGEDAFRHVDESDVDESERRIEQRTRWFPQRRRRWDRWNRCGRVRQLPESSRASSFPPCHPQGVALRCKLDQQDSRRVGYRGDRGFPSTVSSSTPALLFPMTMPWDRCCCYRCQRPGCFWTWRGEVPVMETMNASYTDTLLASCRKDSSSVVSNKPEKQLLSCA